MLLRIPRAYDSHLHFFATGEMHSTLSLRNIHSADDLRKLEIRQEHFRGNFLVAFGWDQHHWDSSLSLTREFLDQLFPDFPVYFLRADGHAAWVNSRYLAQAKSLDLPAHLSGVYVEMEKEQLAQLLPPLSAAQLRTHALLAQDIFLKEGFTHLRDVGATAAEWQILQELEAADQLRVFLELHYQCGPSLAEVQPVVEWLCQQRKQSQHLRQLGIKIYYDGSLGSQTALLSQNYPGTQQNGMRLWQADELQKVIELVWSHDLELSVHTLGDLAVHEVAEVALRVKNHKTCRLNLEHTQVLQDRTLPLLQKLNICCHLQPSHFLDDRAWLKDKLGSLLPDAFPWQKLAKAGIEFDFGSDSPITAPILAVTQRALAESELFGVPPLDEPEWWRRHSHPDTNWGREQVSDFHL